MATFNSVGSLTILVLWSCLVFPMHAKLYTIILEICLKVYRVIFNGKKVSGKIKKESLASSNDKSKLQNTFKQLHLASCKLLFLIRLSVARACRNYCQALS